MLKLLLSLALIVFLLYGVCALCNETQIDINTANATELQEITQIGPARAQAIIDSRPFSSVDDLSRISGIGNGTRLSQIKAQGLACVSADAEQTVQETQTQTVQNETTENVPESIQEENSETANTVTSNSESQKNSAPSTKTTTLDIIELNSNSKDIKTDNGKESLKKNLALGGIVTFCLLFGGLFFLKSIDRRRKNEFR